MPPITLPEYPMINGVRHDWSSVQCDVAGFRFRGLKSLSYKHSLDPGEVRGTGPQVLGTTLGTYSAEGSLEMYLREYYFLIGKLGPGYLATSFNITSKYSAFKGDPIIKDQLIGCRIKTPAKDLSQSNEALTVKVDLFVTLLIENGVNPLPETLGV